MAERRRKFRLVIDDVTAEQASQLLELTRRLRGPDEIERATATAGSPGGPTPRSTASSCIAMTSKSRPRGFRRKDYPATGFRVSQDVPHKQTVVEFNAQRVPLTGLRLVTDDTNFSRLATLQTPPAAKKGGPWQTVAVATLSRFSFETLHRNDLSMTFSEQRQRQYRVVLENRDSPPLSISGVAVEGPVYQLVFLGAPGASHARLRVARCRSAVVRHGRGPGIARCRLLPDDRRARPGRGKHHRPGAGPVSLVELDRRPAHRDRHRRRPHADSRLGPVSSQPPAGQRPAQIARPLARRRTRSLLEIFFAGILIRA